MNDERLLALLFAQLTWPSLLVRERACVSIARLLADPENAGPISNYLLRWLGAQELESVAALGLLALLRAQIEGVEQPVPVDAVAAAVTRPSIQSFLLLGEYAPGRVTFDASASHSGTAPASFEAEPFFEGHVRNFLPPIYDIWASKIEKQARIPFRRQWAYEWGLAKSSIGVELSVKPLEFWLSGSSYKDRYQGADMPLSEVYRSAYLRSLGWAVHAGALSRDDAVFFAAQACPIDLELWRLEPGRRPPWWPQVEEAAARSIRPPAQSGGPSRGSGRHTLPATRHGAATGPWPRLAVAYTRGRRHTNSISPASTRSATGRKTPIFRT